MFVYAVGREVGSPLRVDSFGSFSCSPPWSITCFQWDGEGDKGSGMPLANSRVTAAMSLEVTQYGSR